MIKAKTNFAYIRINVVYQKKKMTIRLYACEHLASWEELRATLIKAHISAEKANKKISITKIAPSSRAKVRCGQRVAFKKAAVYPSFSDFRHNWDILVIGCSVFTVDYSHNICFGVEAGRMSLQAGTYGAPSLFALLMSSS